MEETKYPIVFQARSDEIYDTVVEYIHKVARRRESNCMEGDKVNYYLEGYDDKRIRTTPSKRKIELTSTVDKEIKKSIENIIKTEIRAN